MTSGYANLLEEEKVLTSSTSTGLVWYANMAPRFIV